VAVADLDADGGVATCEAIHEAGGVAAPFPLDVSRAEECRSAVAAATERFGGLDLLCNAAGVLGAGHATEIPEAEWQRIVSVNLSGTWFMCQAAIPALLERRGVLVNIGSSAALVGQAYTAPYAATKAGVVSLSRSLAVEYGKRGLRVSCVCPGAVLTPLVRGFRLPADADPDLIRRLAPLTDIAQPEEIAAAVAYLASDEARYVNGAVLAIDGGQTAG
jgi:meso-butanediol dehydrogenase/(S,S)-butanediol dehydrogenase/diacetyl reductase